MDPGYNNTKIQLGTDSNTAMVSNTTQMELMTPREGEPNSLSMAPSPFHALRSNVTWTLAFRCTSWLTPHVTSINSSSWILVYIQPVIQQSCAKPVPCMRMLNPKGLVPWSIIINVIYLGLCLTWMLVYSKYVGKVVFIFGQAHTQRRMASNPSIILNVRVVSVTERVGPA